MCVWGLYQPAKAGIAFTHAHAQHMGVRVLLPAEGASLQRAANCKARAIEPTPIALQHQRIRLSLCIPACLQKRAIAALCVLGALCKEAGSGSGSSAVKKFPNHRHGSWRLQALLWQRGRERSQQESFLPRWQAFQRGVAQELLSAPGCGWAWASQRRPRPGAGRRGSLHRPA